MRPCLLEHPRGRDRGIDGSAVNIGHGNSLLRHTLMRTDVFWLDRPSQFQQTPGNGKQLCPSLRRPVLWRQCNAESVIEYVVDQRIPAAC
jgi:hypothetical protein